MLPFKTALSSNPLFRRKKNERVPQFHPGNLLARTKISAEEAEAAAQEIAFDHQHFAANASSIYTTLNTQGSCFGQVVSTKTKAMSRRGATQQKALEAMFGATNQAGTVASAQCNNDVDDASNMPQIPPASCGGQDGGGRGGKDKRGGSGGRGGGGTDADKAGAAELRASIDVIPAPGMVENPLHTSTGSSEPATKGTTGTSLLGSLFGSVDTIEPASRDLPVREKGAGQNSNKTMTNILDRFDDEFSASL